MRPLRILVCDDEPLATDRMTGLLGKLAEIETLGSCSSGEQLLEEMATLRPDLVLLDIEMPGLDGFDVVEAMSRREHDGFAPLVIFVTAHPEYAFEAFDSGAIDFLSKPVRLQRLERALGRARTAIEQRESARRLATLMETLEELRSAAAKGAQSRHIWVQKKTERIRLELELIESIEAEGEYVRLHAGETSYLQRGPLGAFAQQLGGESFARVHRSAIVNVRHVSGIGRSSWGGLVLRMRSGRLVRVGRNYKQGVRAILGNGDPE
jgi:DNA-binding LytR/AlgR family response regulator